MSKSRAQGFRSKRVLTVPWRDFEKLGDFRLAYAVETKTIDKALPGCKPVTEK